MISTKRSPACFFPDEPKSINVELFEYSDGVTRGSVRGRNRPKDCGCPDYPSLYQPLSQCKRAKKALG